MKTQIQPQFAFEIGRLPNGFYHVVRNDGFFSAPDWTFEESQKLLDSLMSGETPVNSIWWNNPSLAK